MTYYPPQSPYQTGMAGTCPRCGEGALFEGYIKVRPACERCGLDFSKADSGDGPAVFLMFIVGFPAVIAVFVLRYGMNLPAPVAFLGSVLIAVGLIAALMRPMKGVMIALQYQQKAAEGALDGGKDDWTA